MYEDSLPIDEFAGYCLAHPSAKKITADWRLDPAAIKKVVVGYLREMGIDFVARNQRKTVHETVLFCIKNSKDLRVMLEKAEAEERARRRSRHSE